MGPLSALVIAHTHDSGGGLFEMTPEAIDRHMAINVRGSLLLIRAFAEHLGLLERSLGEVKRRTKVMGRFPGEESCLTLVWAVLDLLITHQISGIHLNALDRQRLKRARYQGTEETIPEEATAA